MKGKGGLAILVGGGMPASSMGGGASDMDEAKVDEAQKLIDAIKDGDAEKTAECLEAFIYMCDEGESEY